MPSLLGYVGYDTSVSIPTPGGTYIRAEVRFGEWCLDTDNTADPITLLAHAVEFQPGQIPGVTAGAWTGWMILHTAGLSLPAVEFSITMVALPEC